MGVALAVRKELHPAAYRVNSNADIQHVACQIRTNCGIITVVSVYIHPQAHVNQNMLERFLEAIPKPCIVGGDFNAKHPLWGSQAENQRGRYLFEALESGNLIVLNNGDSTRFDVNRSWSAIDLTLVSPELSLILDWAVQEDPRGSDHFPIVFGFSETTVIQRPRNLNWKKIDWNQFADKLEDDLVEISELVDYSQFFQLVWNALTFSTPKRTQQPHLTKVPQPYWDEELSAAKLETRTAFKMWKRMLTPESYNEYTAAEERFRSMVKRKKTESWRNFCDNLDSSTSLNTLWRMARRFKGRSSGGSRESIPKTILEKLLIKLAPCTSRRNPVEFSECNCRNHVRGNFFSMCDLRAVLKTGKDSSPGVDGVPYSVIANLPFVGFRTLLKIYNEAFENGIIPEDWKAFQIVAIPKPNHQLDSVSSVRPIALASCFRKIYELLIKEKLEWHMESKNLFPMEMCGFRKGKGTVDAVNIIVEESQEALQQREHVLVCSVDIKSAYDNVDIELLINEMKLMKVDECLVKAVYSLFQERVIVGTTNDQEELYRTTWKGLPQGSPLSPICFNIFITRLMNNIPRGIIKVNYADDIMIAVRGKLLEDSCEILQEGLDVLVQGISSLGLEISTSKSSTMVIARGALEEEPVIKIYGEIVPCVRSMKALGIYLTSNLSWSRQITHIKQRTLPYINFLRSIAGQYWGAHPQMMLQIYKSCVRPILEYGSIFLAKIPKKDALILDRIQYSCIRICLGSTKTTHTGSLEVMAGLTPLSIRREVSVMRFVNKRLGLEHWQGRFGQCQIVSRSPIKDAIAQFHDFFPSTNTLPNLPCFLFDSNVRIKSLSINLSIKSKMGQPTELSVNELVEKVIAESYSGSKICATDGSKELDGTGYAVVNNFGAPSISVKLPTNVSVYMAELLAIYKAVYLIRDSPKGKYLVLSDSMSALKSLQSTRIESSTPMAWYEIKQCVADAELNGSEIAFLWVPSHRGVLMNEHADLLAKEACTSGVEESYALSSLDVTYPAKSTGREKWQTLWSAGSMGRFCYSILPTVSQESWFNDLGFSRRQIIILSKFISNHSRLPAHLKRNGIINDDLCSCGVSSGDPDHILFVCSEYENQRRKLWRAIVKKGIIPDVQVILKDKDVEVLQALADFIIECNIDM